MSQFPQRDPKMTVRKRRGPIPAFSPRVCAPGVGADRRHDCSAGRGCAHGAGRRAGRFTSAPKRCLGGVADVLNRENVPARSAHRERALLVVICGNHDIRGQRTRSGAGPPSRGRFERLCGRQASAARSYDPRDSACARIMRTGTGCVSPADTGIHAATSAQCTQCAHHATERPASRQPWVHE
jgi:hypothetical protein